MGKRVLQSHCTVETLLIHIKPQADKDAVKGGARRKRARRIGAAVLQIKDSRPCSSLSKKHKQWHTCRQDNYCKTWIKEITDVLKKNKRTLSQEVT